MSYLEVYKKCIQFESLVSRASDVFVYTFIRSESLDYVKQKGLLSSSLVVKDPKALRIARPGKRAREQLKKRVEDASEEDTFFIESVSAFFTLPDWSKIPEKHYINKWDLVPIKINISKLNKDHPETKFFGVELKKWNDKLSEEENLKQREKALSLRSVKELTEKNPSEVWKEYKGTDVLKYAPDVPHLMIRTPMKKIPSKYLSL